jgi:cyclopropane fatty-acyl-phospholipid synthase-like methyltransferase
MSSSSTSGAPRAPARDVASSPTSRAVARYYDATTRMFLRADTARTATIHRRIWAPGVTSARAAAEYVRGLVAEAIGSAARDVLDLGCGVGATSFWLSEALGVRATGVTISHVQCALAQEAARRGGLEDRCRFIHADFMRLSDVLPALAFDAAFSIEAFIHAPDASALFGEVARVLRPGGRLLLCDDVLTRRAPADDPVLARVRRSWHASSLLTPEVIIELASAQGLTLIGDRDLTSHMRLSAPLLLRALAVTGDLLAALPWIGASGFVDNWVGGTALQQCQHRGWMDYRFLSFEKRER